MSLMTMILTEVGKDTGGIFVQLASNVIMCSHVVANEIIVLERLGRHRQWKEYRQDPQLFPLYVMS